MPYFPQFKGLVSFFKTECSEKIPLVLIDFAWDLAFKLRKILQLFAVNSVVRKDPPK